MPKIGGNNRHHIYLSDTATFRIYELDESGTVLWSYPLGKYEYVFDLHAMRDGNILFCHYGAGQPGVRIIDHSGRILLDYVTDGEIFSCCPLADGNIAVAEQGNCRITVISSDGVLLSAFPVFYDGENRHEIMRTVRAGADGSLYLVQPGLERITRYSTDGRKEESYSVRPDAFGVAEKPDGNLLYTCMSGIYEIDRRGHEIGGFTDQDAPWLGMRWPLGFQLLPNGNIMAVNWLGHGHDGEGIPAFEITQDKQIAWYCDSRDIMINPANIAVIGMEQGGI